jgi:hypothetical protein
LFSDPGGPEGKGERRLNRTEELIEGNLGKLAGRRTCALSALGVVVDKDDDVIDLRVDHVPEEAPSSKKSGEPRRRAGNEQDDNYGGTDNHAPDFAGPGYSDTPAHLPNRSEQGLTSTPARDDPRADDLDLEYSDLEFAVPNPGKSAETENRTRELHDDEDEDDSTDEGLKESVDRSHLRDDQVRPSRAQMGKRFSPTGDWMRYGHYIPVSTFLKVEELKLDLSEATGRRITTESVFRLALLHLPEDVSGWLHMLEAHVDKFGIGDEPVQTRHFLGNRVEKRWPTLLSRVKLELMQAHGLDIDRRFLFAALLEHLVLVDRNQLLIELTS